MWPYERHGHIALVTISSGFTVCNYNGMPVYLILMHLLSEITIIIIFNYSALEYCCRESTDGGVRGVFQWNETEVNSTASTICHYGSDRVMATRRCVSRYTWAAPSIDQCRTVASEQFSNIQQVEKGTILIVSLFIYIIAGECQF